MQALVPSSSRPERHVFVSRQAIYTPQIEAWGYVLRFPHDTEDPAREAQAYQTVAQGILTSVLELGFDALVGDKPAFVPLTRGFLLLGYVTALPADRVVLLLSATLAVDTALCESLRDIAARGYALALDGQFADEALQALVAYADFLTLDVSNLDRPGLTAQSARLRQYDRPLVAMQVQAWDEVQVCTDLGFAYLHGPFVRQPDCIKVPSLPTNRLTLVRILAQLQNPRSSVDVLADLISQDVTLSYRILRAINSAYYGLARPVVSIREAVRLLGLMPITLWTSLMLLAGGHVGASEVLTIAMVRADMCAQFARALAYAHPDSALLVGLFSVLEAVLHRPMAEILQTLPLAADIQEALLDYTGGLGTILRAVLAYEQGDGSASLGLGLDAGAVRDAYLHALTWAAGMQEVLAQTAS